MSAQFGAEQLFCVLNFIRDSDMNEHEKILCYTLIQYRNFEKDPEKKRENPNDAWPSIDRLAGQCGVSRRTLQYAMEGLVSRGLVTKIPRLGQSNLFRLNMDKWERVQGVHPCIKCTRAGNAQGVCTTCTGGVQEMHEGGAPRAHRTNKENKLREQVNNTRTALCDLDAVLPYDDVPPPDDLFPDVTEMVEQPKAKPKAKRRTKASKEAEFQTLLAKLQPEGVSETMLRAYLEVRKSKRAGAFTDGAIELMRKDASKDGYTLLQAIERCVSKGWVGFYPPTEWERKRTKQNAKDEYRRKLQEDCVYDPNKPTEMKLAEDGVTIIL